MSNDDISKSRQRFLQGGLVTLPTAGFDLTSLAHIVLAGSSNPSTSQAPTQFKMPPLADRLSDQDIADILSFVRTGRSNHKRAWAPDKSRVCEKCLLHHWPPNPSMAVAHLTPAPGNYAP